jgi:ubiquinone/menaquinone biosynthesis C-methylase UbiE
MHRRHYQSMKNFYNWFHRYYGFIEKSLGLKLDKILERKIIPLIQNESKTILEYACGSGLLSLKLAMLCKIVDGRDSSEGMINRAIERANNSGIKNVSFRIGNILEPDETSDSYDYVFVSFALHLFSPEIGKIVLRKLFNIAKEAVVIIDHGRKWEFMTALVEWIEGSYYDKFLKTDFNSIGKEIGAAYFEEEQIDECTVLLFRK